MKILFVENHSVFAAQVIPLFLSDHEVTVVPGLAEGRRAVSAAEFDLLLVDYDLDDGKGEELVGEIRANHSRLPIIGVSSHEAGNRALLKAGANAVCSKMNFDQIQTVIQKLIGTE
jgi:DNA-binding response OmpR family regulator